MPRVISLIAALCAALALACGGDDDNGADATDTTGADAIATMTPAELTPTPETSTPDEKPTEAPTREVTEISVANEAVSLETPDGVVIEGLLYAPEGPKRQALVIIAPVDQVVWAESTQALTSEGIAVFTFDPRGFGETGGETAPDSLATDAQLAARFVMSREYPLVYLMGVGEEGSPAAVEAASNLPELEGFITYGFSADLTGNTLSLAPAAIWDGEDVLAEPEVQQMVLNFVLGE